MLPGTILVDRVLKKSQHFWGTILATFPTTILSFFDKWQHLKLAPLASLRWRKNAPKAKESKTKAHSFLNRIQHYSGILMKRRGNKLQNFCGFCQVFPVWRPLTLATSSLWAAFRFLSSLIWKNPVLRKLKKFDKTVFTDTQMRRLV